MRLGWKECSLKVFEAVAIAFRMDEYNFYQLNECATTYYTGQYSCNRIGKWASVETHGDPKGKKSVS